MEESKEKQPSQQQAPAPASTAGPAMAQQKPPATAAPPRPAVVPPRPATPPSPPPAAAPKPGGRRLFLKGLVTVGAILSVIPFVPWGSFLTSSVTGASKPHILQKVVIDNNTDKYGPAAGQPVKVTDTNLFPPNSHWVFTFPTSGDPTIDAQNPDTFQKFELIRLPESIGGANMKATDFVAFSKVCVHLWCSPNYIPSEGHMAYECPCHGSIYGLEGLTYTVNGKQVRPTMGKAIDGPASLQAPPTNAIPMLTLQADPATGFLYAVAMNHDPDAKNGAYPDGGALVPDDIGANGSLGFGRDFNSYDNYIKVKGGEPANLKLAQETV